MRFAVIPKDEQLTVRQAGALVGYSHAAVTRWIEDGARCRDGSRLKLRAERHPAGWRTTETWVRDFISALTADRTGPAPSKAIDDGARRDNAVCAASGW
jgi:hypothetical protein